MEADGVAGGKNTEFKTRRMTGLLINISSIFHYNLFQFTNPSHTYFYGITLVGHVSPKHSA